MMPKEFLDLSFPAEERSSCMNCPKSCLDGFRPDYRCCTYLPRIPNFLLGLSTEVGQGFAQLETIIAKGLATPEGMNGTPRQWVDYLEDLEEDAFGKSQRVLCPMLDTATGYCRVHAFRNSVCSTFFCIKDHGKKGDTFWESVQTLGSQVEMAITHWAMNQVGFDVESYMKRVNSLSKKIKKVHVKGGGWSNESLRLLWGDWYGKEVDFFLECAALVKEHRHLLWDIANQSEIEEAKKFDRAMVKSVPKKLADQLDESDLDDSEGETVAPEDLWKNCKRSYEKLWKLKPQSYRLSKRFELKKNKLETEIEKYHKDRPYYVKKKKESDTEDHLFLRQDEFEVLEGFQESTLVDWSFFARDNVKALANPKDFISRIYSQKILTPVSD